MKSLGWIVFLWVGLGCVPAFAAGEISERLEVTLPDGWVLAGYRGEGPVKITEWVPAGQTADAWTEMITLQVHEDPAGASSQAVADQLIRNGRKMLNRPEVRRSQPALEDGIEVLEVSLKGRDAAGQRPPLECRYKLLRGQDRFFVVQWVRQGETADAGLPAWESFSNDVRVRKTAGAPDR